MMYHQGENIEKIKNLGFNAEGLAEQIRKTKQSIIESKKRAFYKKAAPLCIFSIILFTLVNCLYRHYSFHSSIETILVILSICLVWFVIMTIIKNVK